MTKEIMAECLEEAAVLFGHPAFDSEEGLLGDDAQEYCQHEYQPIATIAVGLYQERMAVQRYVPRWMVLPPSDVYPPSTT